MTLIWKTKRSFGFNCKQLPFFLSILFLHSFSNFLFAFVLFQKQNGFPELWLTSVIQVASESDNFNKKLLTNHLTSLQRTVVGWELRVSPRKCSDSLSCYLRKKKICLLFAILFISSYVISNLRIFEVEIESFSQKTSNLFLQCSTFKDFDVAAKKHSNAFKRLFKSQITHNGKSFSLTSFKTFFTKF